MSLIFVTNPKEEDFLVCDDLIPDESTMLQHLESVDESDIVKESKGIIRGTLGKFSINELDG